MLVKRESDISFFVNSDINPFALLLLCSLTPSSPPHYCHIIFLRTHCCPAAIFLIMSASTSFIQPPESQQLGSPSSRLMDYEILSKPVVSSTNSSEGLPMQTPRPEFNANASHGFVNHGTVYMTCCACGNGPSVIEINCERCGECQHDKCGLCEITES
jgi:hypothetical protein